MEMKTKYHGMIKVDEEEILYFEHGLPGFIDERKFVLLPLEENSPYYIMQSVTTIELGFIVTDPFSFFKDYEFDLTSNEKEALKIGDESTIQVLTILSLRDPFTDTTANLQAPIVVNHSEMLAKQIILNKTSYTTKHRLFQETVNK
ncbi:flagellar assembly protein FliW [Metabacillus sp. B2-18]|uniref:flagellar assembly protein FliW n=1 Tax=Metabacillus sp. B2-18 TaxID=2897333 RepID=UPI001E373E31|nr:flagellar assembly protein FliW [Metabacillus sp. B2-18]UGB30437.1 flagellar assembly protein FliW [Metabacillus sp. B2-18]